MSYCERSGWCRFEAFLPRLTQVLAEAQNNCDQFGDSSRDSTQSPSEPLTSRRDCACLQDGCDQIDYSYRKSRPNSQPQNALDW